MRWRRSNTRACWPRATCPSRFATARRCCRRVAPKRAHEVLLDLFNNVPPTQEQIRLTAMAANAAGDVADAYSYMAEYHLMGGDLMLAINQLELALSVPSITDQQRAKFVARLKEVREWLPKERNRSKQPPDGQAPDGKRSAPAFAGLSTRRRASNR